jgi:opacity protein-like surface antigen
VNLRAILLYLALSLVASPLASAQTQDAQADEKNEIGLILGVNATPSRSLTPGSILGYSELTSKASLALGVDYDRRVFATDWVTLYGGGDFLASPFDVKLDTPPANVSPQYAYFFLTAHVKAKFYPDRRVSPWLSIGGGYARFKEKPPTATVDPFTPGTGRSTIEMGAGFDTQPVTHIAGFPIAFRVEVRDFYSGLPNYGQGLVKSHQHNVILGGGLVVRF